MSGHHRMIAVYRYELWDNNNGIVVVPNGMRTEDWIKENNGKLLVDTKLFIEHSKLDEFDCYIPPQET